MTNLYLPYPFIVLEVPRPLTFTLTANLLEASGAELEEVRIRQNDVDLAAKFRSDFARFQSLVPQVEIVRQAITGLNGA